MLGPLASTGLFLQALLQGIKATVPVFCQNLGARHKGQPAAGIKSLNDGVKEIAVIADEDRTACFWQMAKTLHAHRNQAAQKAVEQEVALFSAEFQGLSPGTERRLHIRAADIAEIKLFDDPCESFDRHLLRAELGSLQDFPNSRERLGCQHA